MVRTARKTPISSQVVCVHVGFGSVRCKICRYAKHLPNTLPATLGIEALFADGLDVFRGRTVEGKDFVDVRQRSGALVDLKPGKCRNLIASEFSM